MTREPAERSLRDGPYPVSREELEAAAHHARPLPTSAAEERPVVIVNDAPYDPADLVSIATEIPVDELQPRRVVETLRATALLSEPAPEDDAFDFGARPEITRELPDPDATPLLSPDLAVQLQRYQGKWVAVRHDAVIADAPDLNALLASIDNQDVLITFVPEGPWGDD